MPSLSPSPDRYRSSNQRSSSPKKCSDKNRDKADLRLLIKEKEKQRGTMARDSRDKKSRDVRRSGSRDRKLDPDSRRARSRSGNGRGTRSRHRSEDRGKSWRGRSRSLDRR